MDEKRKLSQEEAEQKIENIRKNLMTRVYTIYREDRTGSIETHKSYLGAESRFCRFLAENYRTARAVRRGISPRIRWNHWREYCFRCCRNICPPTGQTGL